MREQTEIKKKRGRATIKERRRRRRRREKKVNEERAKGAGWRYLLIVKIVNNF